MEIELNKDIINEAEKSCFSATEWIELVTPVEASVWASYKHKFWGSYAAITHNSFGAGTATYIACHTEKDVLKTILKKLCKIAGIKLSALSLPIIKQEGINEDGKLITFYFNYSSDNQSFNYDGENGTNLLQGTPITSGETVTLNPWDLIIVEV